MVFPLSQVTTNKPPIFIQRLAQAPGHLGSAGRRSWPWCRNGRGVGAGAAEVRGSHRGVGAGRLVCDLEGQMLQKMGYESGFNGIQWDMMIQ